MVDQPIVVDWTMSGLPPSYVERRWHAPVPSELRSAVQAFVDKMRFFDLPEDLGANDPHGRDMGSYSISVVIGGRAHTVRFSDSTQTAALAEFRAWLMEHLAATATVG